MQPIPPLSQPFTQEKKICLFTAPVYQEEMHGDSTVL